jgi:hypothetical protein
MPKGPDFIPTLQARKVSPILFSASRGVRQCPINGTGAAHRRSTTLYFYGCFVLFFGSLCFFWSGSFEGTKYFYDGIISNDFTAHWVVPFPLDLFGASLFIMFSLCPALICRQAEHVEEFIPFSVYNGILEGPQKSRRIKDLTAEIEKINRQFEFIGGRKSFLATIFLSFLTSTLFFRYAKGAGIYSGKYRELFGHRPLTKPISTYAYNNWWVETLPQGLNIAFRIVSIVWLYCFIKEIILGWIFLRFASKLTKMEIPYQANMSTNYDGFRGMRHVRQMTIVTYIVTLIQSLTFLCTFYLIFKPTVFTVSIGALVMLSPVWFVLIPTNICRMQIIRSKTNFVLEATDKEMRKIREEVWSWRNFPFGMRNLASATVLYLVFPVTVALLGR